MNSPMVGRASARPDATSRLFGTKPLKAYSLRSGKVEAIEVHRLGPGPDEVLDELRLRIRASVDLRQGPELGVRTEDEIDTRAGPLDLARLAIAPFETRPWRPRPPSTPCPCRAGSRRSRGNVTKLCPTQAYSRAFERTPAHDAVGSLVFHIKQLRALTRTVD